jgi:hypothetical protein
MAAAQTVIGKRVLLQKRADDRLRCSRNFRKLFNIDDRSALHGWAAVILELVAANDNGDRSVCV